MPRTTGSQRLRTLRKHLKQTRGWSLARFARELGFSATYIKVLERGAQPVTFRVIEALKRLERDTAFCAKEITDTDTELLDWLLTALEQRRGELTGASRRRIKKLLED